jgi:acyl-CoA reductase-like NAD-dependent aldehyde dehydrogenase
MKTARMFIGGEWQEAAQGQTREILNPRQQRGDRHSGRRIGADAEKAIAFARQALTKVRGRRREPRNAPGIS